MYGFVDFKIWILKVSENVTVRILGGQYSDNYFKCFEFSIFLAGQVMPSESTSTSKLTTLPTTTTSFVPKADEELVIHFSFSPSKLGQIIQLDFLYLELFDFC